MKRNIPKRLKTLINFRLDNDHLVRLDAVCHALRKTRTAVMIEMIDAFVVDRAKNAVAAELAYVALDDAIERGSLSAWFEEDVLDAFGRSTNCKI